jgi:hypothetical protein
VGADDASYVRQEVSDTPYFIVAEVAGSFFGYLANIVLLRYKYKPLLPRLARPTGEARSGEDLCATIATVCNARSARTGAIQPDLVKSSLHNAGQRGS